MDTRTILLDVGGTFIKCSDGRQIPVPSSGSRMQIQQSLKDAVGPVEAVDAVGVAIPGPFDYREGIFLMKHKFASVYGCSFREIAGLQEDVSLKFMHDVNAVLAGALEMLDLGSSNCALVTLGTGLGFSYAVSGVVQCNQSLSPAYGLWNLPHNGGILEDRISGRGIVSAYEQITGGSGLSAYDVARLAFSGDQAALDVYQGTGRLLGQVLAPLARKLELSAVLIGGQISKSLSLFVGPLEGELPGVAVVPSPEGAVFRGLKSMF